MKSIQINVSAQKVIKGEITIEYLGNEGNDKIVIISYECYELAKMFDVKFKYDGKEFFIRKEYKTTGLFDSLNQKQKWIIATVLNDFEKAVRNAESSTFGYSNNRPIITDAQFDFIFNIKNQHRVKMYDPTLVVV